MSWQQVQSSVTWHSLNIKQNSQKECWCQCFNLFWVVCLNQNQFLVWSDEVEVLPQWIGRVVGYGGDISSRQIWHCRLAEISNRSTFQAAWKESLLQKTWGRPRERWNLHLQEIRKHKDQWGLANPAGHFLSYLDVWESYPVDQSNGQKETLRRHPKHTICDRTLTLLIIASSAWRWYVCLDHGESNWVSLLSCARDAHCIYIYIYVHRPYSMSCM